MAAGRPTAVCLYCQARQAALGRRRFGVSKRRLDAAIALRPEDDGFILSKPTQDGTNEGPVLSPEVNVRQWALHSRVDELREAALGFDALWKGRDLRIERIRKLSNPWPDPPGGRPERYTRTPERLAVVNMAPIPHALFREMIRQAVGHKPIRSLLRVQLLRCEWPREILRVIAVAMQNKEVAAHLGTLHEPIMRALYRCRQNVSDPEVLKTLNIVLSRFQLAGITHQPQLLYMALKFAARARSLPAMKRHLKAIREAGLPISSNLFRAVVAKFSIGHRGLGEIRNGRWRRRDLEQVIKGFEDAEDLPPEQQYHFGSFLDRTDWQYLHGWIAVLARCRDSDAVWKEYELWKQSDSWKNPKKLVLRHSNKTMTNKTRGNLWFIEQMLCSGDANRAWKIIAETDTEFHLLKPTVKDRILDKMEYATIWTNEMRDEMIRKYDRDLQKIEQAFGVKWVRTGPDGEGQHELYMDQEEALDKLGDENWKQNEEHGYPYDSDQLVPDEERALRDAIEGKALEQVEL